jgi:hypothetical protein
MSLEAPGFIKDLVATNPLGTDPKSEGDDHIRNIKSCLKSQFSGLTQGKAVTVNEDAINSIPALAARIWPVGCIYLSVNAANPATILGIGTWSRLGAGRMMVDYDATFALGATGGAATVALTEAQMPAHNHAITTWGQGTTYVSGVCGQTNNTAVGDRATQSKGSGAAHENMPPWIGVCMWKRDA